MAGTKAIMGVCLLSSRQHFEPFQVQSLLLCRHSIQEQELYSYKTKLRLRKKVKQTPTMAVFIEEKPMELAMAEKPMSMTVKLKPLVALRNNKAFAKELVKNLFENLKLQGQSNGIVMQAVSTELDPRSREQKLSKETVLEWSKDLRYGVEGGTYKVEFVVVGIPGAVIVSNNYESLLGKHNH